MTPGLLLQLVAEVVETKVKDPSADIRQHVWAAVQGDHTDLRAMCVDALNLVDALGSLLGVHYATVSGEGAIELARRIADDVRFVNIIQQLEDGPL